MTNRKEDRYFAVPDPDDQAVMTYWREHEDRYGIRRFSPWPDKAHYGPVLWKRDLPRDPKAKRAMREAHWARSREWRTKVRALVDADRFTAGKRFADWQVRCCFCGRALTEEHSKVYGVGPECRAGIPAEVLARYATPVVARAHAAQLAGVELSREERTIRFDRPALPIAD